MAAQVAAGRLSNGLALVRPPGHHAMHDEACGYCIFNNIAVAIASLLDSPPKAVTFNSGNMSKVKRSAEASNNSSTAKPTTMKRILVVDWDVHQGQGTQYMFYNDER